VVSERLRSGEADQGDDDHDSDHEPHRDLAVGHAASVAPAPSSAVRYLLIVWLVQLAQAAH
jgi:hypothetical protein